MKFRRDATVIDLIYAPRQTRFLKYAKESGTQFQNGLVMLIAQASESFQIWTGIDFPFDKALNQLLPELVAA